MHRKTTVMWLLGLWGGNVVESPLLKHRDGYWPISENFGFLPLRDGPEVTHITTWGLVTIPDRNPIYRVVDRVNVGRLFDSCDNGLFISLMWWLKEGLKNTPE
ncbi:hypothetical protein EDB83DRAFT_2451757 [Lactarius deliciosus]|nr:hypothetical protein EDB83DRAFT_2451757 [Lactarius deliciosus]